MDGSWIESYGYWAVFFGGMLEGETVLILAGYSISRGYLDPLPTLLLAAAGGATGDFIYYSIGRRYGPTLIRRFPPLRRLRARAVLFVRRWGRQTAFLTRFIYGMRIILPMSMGSARFRPSVFIPYNVMGALSFAALYLTLGFLFGQTVQEMLGRVRPYERWILLALVLLGAIIWGIREWRLYRGTGEDAR
jgi:membrane protein DedA with SNARE-associated domain